MNGDVLGEQVDLSEFLFGSERSALLAIRPLLMELQNRRCFYCPSTIAEGGGEVDHFVPWSRYPADLAHNLVLADRKCNGQKRDRIPAVTHLAEWSKRNDLFGKQVTAAMPSRLPCDSNASTRIAYWAYEQTETFGGLSWFCPDELAPIPAKPSASYRFRHSSAVNSDVDSLRAMARFAIPSVAARTIPTRN